MSPDPQKQSQPETQAEKIGPPSFAELFDKREYFNSKKSLLGTITIDLAKNLRNKLTQTIPALSLNKAKFTPAHIFMFGYLAGIEHMTAKLVNYISADLDSDRVNNCLDAYTLASPAKNKFVRAGIDALSIALVHHNAAHVVKHLVLTPGSTGPVTDEEVQESTSRCSLVTSVLEALREKFPEQFITKKEVKQ
ncbi:MAG: hypothetical protein P4L77_12170 [Sulfuriferula sp.]|nr:hypothetical protein [Sulfuriferula sp.]